MATKKGAEAAPKTTFNAPPEKLGGDAIDLSKLAGKTIAVFLTGKQSVETKFGPRDMVSAVILTPASAEPLSGVMFAKYFTSNLELKKWYAGLLTQSGNGNRKGWILEASKDAAALTKLGKYRDSMTEHQDAKETDVPF